LRRAAHQILDHPHVLDDPLAPAIVGLDADGVEALRQDEDEQRPLARYMRAFMVARSRVAEDELARAVSRGVRQYVVLGAGLDTFAYRNPFGERVRVFEVDFPATQAWKREALVRAGIPTPASVTFVPVDFEHQTAFEGLRLAGFDSKTLACFSWLGVTMYLSVDTVFSVLREIAALPPGGGIVFDYAITPDVLDGVARRVFDELARRVARAGEPWTTFFDPATLMSELSALGFRDVNDAGPEDINARYFSDRADGLRVGTIGRIMTART
jgi:methyltransferase (TIGR00027 family)